MEGELWVWPGHRLWTVWSPGISLDASREPAYRPSQRAGLHGHGAGCSGVPGSSQEPSCLVLPPFGGWEGLLSRGGLCRRPSHGH